MERVFAIAISGLLLCLCSPAGFAEPASSRSSTNYQANATLSLSRLYDSNIYASEGDRIDDWVTTITPRLQLDSSNSQADIELELGTELGRYQEQSREDYNDYWITLDVSKALDNGLRLFGGLEYSADHEDRDTPDNRHSGDEPTTLNSLAADLGLRLRSDALQLQLGATYEALRFDNTPSDGDLLINDDRDRQKVGAGLRLMRVSSPKQKLFAQFFYDRRDYRDSADILDFRRDSHGYRAAIGMQYDHAPHSRFEAYIGTLQQRYAETRFSRLQALDLGARLDWRLRTTTRLQARLTRSLEETTLADAAGYLITEVDLTLQEHLAPDWNAQLSAYIAHLDYQDVARNDRLGSLGIDIKYAVSPKLSLRSGVRWMARDTQDAIGNPFEAFDYRRTVLSLALEARTH